MSYFDLSWVTVAPVLLEISDKGTRKHMSSQNITTKSVSKEINIDCISKSSENDLSSPHQSVGDVLNTKLGLELNIDSLNQVQIPDPFPKKIKRVQVKSDPLAFVPSYLDRNYFNFPFFIDKRTYRYLNLPDTRVMFIMRGLPGSGKSTLVDIIRSAFRHAVVCSADNYFYTADGNYNFDEKLLSTAHGDCQHKAKQACQSKVPIIVIDNTNVKKWEMKFYANLANISGYVVVLVEPKTTWKWNPQDLALRNKHSIPVEIIQRKVSAFDDINPAYYGWFLNEKISKCLTHFCSKLFSECIAKYPGLKNDLLKELRINPQHIDEETAKGILLEYYTQHGTKSPILHCTAKFCRWGKAPGAISYHTRKDVQKACGQVFDLTIAGIVITKKTLSARVSLSTSACNLFDKPEERGWGSPLSKTLLDKGATGGKIRGTGQDFNDMQNSKSKKKEKKKLTKLEKRAKKMTVDSSLDSSNSSDFDPYSFEDGGSDTACTVNQSANEDVELSQLRLQSVQNNGEKCWNGKYTSDIDDSVSLGELFPSLRFSGFSRSAHFTVKTVRNVESREVNFDILQACDLENKTVFKRSDFTPVSRGQALYYGDGLCCVYFDRPLTVKTLFSGYY